MQRVNNSMSVLILINESSVEQHDLLIMPFGSFILRFIFSVILSFFDLLIHFFLLSFLLCISPNSTNLLFSQIKIILVMAEAFSIKISIKNIN